MTHAARQILIAAKDMKYFNCNFGHISSNPQLTLMKVIITISKFSSLRISKALSQCKKMSFLQHTLSVMSKSKALAFACKSFVDDYANSPTQCSKTRFSTDG
jgi:hypothetical protein